MYTMKRSHFAGIFLLLLSFSAFSQANDNYKFSSSNSHVIAYKQGTSCTASPYAFYLVSGAGVQASSPFYTLANTSREVNGIGINPVDFFLYGVEYDRNAACAFSNFHLKRYDTQGNSDDLGALPVLDGGVVTAALGCVTSNGNFVDSARDLSGNTYVCIIANVASLPANAGGTLTVTASKQIINNAATYSYADWAVHPSNGKIYTYGIANIGGVSTGRVLELDPATGLLQGVGQTNGTLFLDAVRDNFGGVYFSSDGMLYGVNVNTRRLYRIDVVTGAAVHVSTITGSGQIRADMGSYATGWIVLPVVFEKTERLQNGAAAALAWQVADARNVSRFVVELSANGSAFAETASIFLTDKEKIQTTFRLTVAAVANAQYRIKAVGTDGKIVYSPVMKSSGQTADKPKLLSNPVRNRELRFLPAASGTERYTVIGANGRCFQSGAVACTKNRATSISLNALPAGIYWLRLEKQATALPFVVD